MKRPVTLILVASLLASGAAFARNEHAKEGFAGKVAQAAARHDDNRGNDRGHDRGNDRGHDRGHDRNDRPGNDHRNDRPRNDYRGYNPPNHNPSNRNGRDWNDHRNDNNRWDNYRSDWNRHPNYWDNRRHDRADYARYRYHYGSYHAPRGYYYRSWHRGDRLPRGWYGGSYVVYNWAPYQLYSPPYGYHWVRVGNDVLLTAVATGIVLDVIYDIWY